MNTSSLARMATPSLCFLAMLMPVWAQSPTASVLQHPRDQIALQLGAIQMGYAVPFTLTGNLSAPKMQQAVNALVMGRNSLNATVTAPAVQVQGAVDCPNVDTVAYRDQLYTAVEYVVTSPVVATIKGSATLVNSKKVTIASTKLTVPPSAWTIPVPYALEARSSADAVSLSDNLTDLTSQVASIGGNLTSLSTQVTSIGGNLSNTTTTVVALSQNLTAVNASLTNLPSSGTAELKSLLISLGVIGDYSTNCTVTTLAGSGAQGSADGTGTSASFYYPGGVAVDSSGNLFVADTGNNKIRKITSAGVVTTLAGSGAQGSADGTGTSASFYYPQGVAADSSGNLFVADTGNNKIRKITSAGVVTTLVNGGLFLDESGTETNGAKLRGLWDDFSG